ncbi:MAG: adenosylcobinamide amidohydrolase [Rhodobacteraceae bacterium]|nr:adenosylcobinamide amidohydrolase [Paracoccaceae bacterium]
MARTDPLRPGLPTARGALMLTLERPWLTYDLGAPMRVLSWAVHRPGFVTASRILWREVHEDDLPHDVDAETWLANDLAARDASDAVTFLTSRDLARHHTHTACIDGITAEAVITIGLANAERIGRREDYTGRDWGKDWGTINIALRVDHPLSDIGLLEAMSLVTEARTAAVIDLGYRLGTGIATGTGTDCIALAAPPGDANYAGKHTALGEAIGKTTYAAILEGGRQWQVDDTERRARSG